VADPSTVHKDRELEQYRNLLETPDEFREGFGWSTVLGIFFCGIVMLPGSIYLGLISGANLGTGATWVTLILFNEIMRRSLRTLSKQHLVILLHAAGVVMSANAILPGGPAAQLVFRAYLVASDAFRDANMTDFLPEWFVPPADSAAITDRNLLHIDWLVPLLLLVFVTLIGFLKRYTLGYFFFRLTSDVEKLPFPMAPINAQGAMALAEVDEGGEQSADPGKRFFDKRADPALLKKKSQRWRLFSLGVVLGLAFGFLQVGVPALTGVILDGRFFLIPQPFIDTTTLTETLLPATPTGVAIDLGMLILGMVLPFWAVMGTGFAVILTIILNPILHEFGVLTGWQPGMDTVNTTFANEVDFWMSFGIGAAVGLLAISLYQSVRDVRRALREAKESKRALAEEDRYDAWDTPEGRGDYPLWAALSLYTLASLLMIGVTYVLLGTNMFDENAMMARPENRGALISVMVFMFVFSFVYNPLISYLNARLLGIAGQTVEIPYVKEAAFILSGAKGLGIWAAPIPIDNYGHQAQGFRVQELTGTSFWSLIKTELVAVPVLLLLSFVFWAFIWASDPIPSAGYPYAQVFWELQSKRVALLWSATHVTDPSESTSFANTQLAQAIHPEWIGTGFLGTVAMFGVMSIFGLPIMFIYGMIKGLGNFPHLFVFEVIGAFIGRFYFQKKFGSSNFLRMVPTILAGYFTGMGLIGMATIALELIKQAVSKFPF